MADPLLAYKKNFRVNASLEVFYTGGPIRVSSDGSFVACACTEDVKVVDVDTGKVRCVLEGDSELVTALVVSHDGKFLISASRSLQIKLWDLSSVSVLRTWKAHEAPVTTMAVDASGGLLATASADRSVLVWDIEGGFCTHAFRGHKGVVTSVVFHPDPKRLLLFSGGDDAAVRVWDLARKTCVSVLDKHFSAVTSLAVSTDGSTLISGGRDKVVNVWELQTFALQKTVLANEAVETVCFVPQNWSFLNTTIDDTKGSSARFQQSGVRFLTVGELGVLRVWHSQSAVCLYSQNKDVLKDASKDESTRGLVQATVIAPSGKVMCVTGDQSLLFYELVDGDFSLYKRLIGYNEEIIDLKFVGKESMHLAVATNIEQVRVYDSRSMACVQELAGHTDIVLCLDACARPSGESLLLSSAKDRTVRLWNMESGTCVALADGHMAAVGAVAFSKKRKDFFVSGSSDSTLKVWNFAGHVLDSDAPAKLSSQATVVAHDKDINAVAIAPNDSLVCSASQDRTARVWKLPELVPVLTLSGHKRGVWSVEFSPVDQCVLTASGDKTIRIWALSDGSCLKSFEGHTASVLKVAFITRGTQVVSAGADGLVKLWTIKTNECTNTFDNHEDKIWALAVNPKHETLATGGADSLINFWEDCTAFDEEEAFRKEEEEILKDQYLANALKDTDYIKAVQLGFELKRPFKLLQVFEDILRLDGAESQMAEILKALGKEHLRLLFEYVRDWNTKSKFCRVAQYIMFNVFRVVPPAALVKVPGSRELLEGLLPYTQRHFGRIDRLSRSTCLLDFILSSMSTLVPSEDWTNKEADGVLPLLVSPTVMQDTTPVQPTLDWTAVNEPTDNRLAPAQILPVEEAAPLGDSATENLPSHTAKVKKVKRKSLGDSADVEFEVTPKAGKLKSKAKSSEGKDPTRKKRLKVETSS